MVDLYEYKNIGESSKKFAIAELKENPAEVNAHIESLRRWVKSMPHLTCPTDSGFLLRFLRVAKFDHKKAQKRLDIFCTMRSSPKGCPHYFKRNDLNEKTIRDNIDSKIFMQLGRVDNGDLIFLIRAKMWNPDDMILEKFVSSLFIILDVIMTEEETQIHGFHLLVDLDDVSKKVIETWADPKYIRNTITSIQDAYPMRLKSLIFYREPAIFSILLSMVLFFMNNKMKQRVIVLKDSLDKAKEKFAGLDKIWPAEYGGHGDRFELLKDNLKEKVERYYREGDPLASICVDESKRPAETSKYLAEYKEYKGQTYSTIGRFKK